MSDALKFLEKENGPTTIGMLFRAYRTRNDLTQEQVADMLGVGKNLISDIENERKAISISKCLEFAKKMGESAIVFAKIWFEQCLRNEKLNVTVEVRPNHFSSVSMYKSGILPSTQRIAAKKATKKISLSTRKKAHPRKAS